MTNDNSLFDVEMARCGNTNRIANSGLGSGKQIFAIGDSHSIFFHNSHIVKEHWFGMSRLPVTMYSLVKNGIDLSCVGKILGSGHEEYEIQQGDYVMFFYGYNDVQKHIHVYGGVKWQEEIAKLVYKYVQLLVSYRESCHITPICVSIYPNALPGAQGQTTNGSPIERHKYTLYTNELLEKMCEMWNLPFLDLYDLISDDIGNIKSNITKDFVHLDYTNANLREMIETKILDLCR